MTKMPLYRATHKPFDVEFVRNVIEGSFEVGGIGADASQLVTAPEPEVAPVVGTNRTNHWCEVCPRNKNLGHGSHQFLLESLNVEHEGIPDKTWTGMDLGHSNVFRGQESHQVCWCGAAVDSIPG